MTWGEVPRAEQREKISRSRSSFLQKGALLCSSSLSHRTFWHGVLSFSWKALGGLLFHTATHAVQVSAFGFHEFPVLITCYVKWKLACLITFDFLPLLLRGKWNENDHLCHHSVCWQPCWKMWSLIRIIYFSYSNPLILDQYYCTLFLQALIFLNLSADKLLKGNESVCDADMPQSLPARLSNSLYGFPFFHMVFLSHLCPVYQR